MRAGIRRAAVMLFLGGISLMAAEVKYPITVSLGGPESLYTPVMLQLLSKWPSNTIDPSKVPADKVGIRCYSTEGREFFIGIEQAVMINAALTRVTGVLDDVGKYVELFPEFADIHVVSTDGNRMTIFWEHRISFPFVPNTKYETNYVVDKTRSDRAVYRYKLKEKTGDMNTADGMIVVEKNGPTSTKYTELDFWDGEYGIAKTLAPKKIWKDSVEETYLSDVAIKLRAEHPDWKSDKLIEEAKKTLDEKDIETCLTNRKTYPL